MKKFWFVLVVLALVFSASQPGIAAPQSSAPIIRGDAAIPGHYIVVLKPGTATSAVDKAIETARGFNATVRFRYEAALLGFAAELSDQAVAALAKNPNVAYIEADQVVSMDATQSPTPSWGLDRVDQRTLPLNNTYNYEFTGTGVTAYIIDTGILPTHVDFGGRATVAADFVGDGQDGIDCNGHGTHVAGTVGGASYGIAKGVTLRAVRVLNCSGSGTTSGVIAGVNWVTTNHAANSVANMSLGGGVSSALDTAVANSIASGVTYSVSAGNSNRDACKFSPARVPAALTVGATTSTDARASYSNYGKCLDVFAPGSSITSAWIGSSNNATNTISGTSMASPHVAGVAALFLQAHPSATPAAVATAITGDATLNVVINAGRGSPNRLLYSLIP